MVRACLLRFISNILVGGIEQYSGLYICDLCGIYDGMDYGGVCHIKID